jgi:hypothetical protein
VRKVSGPVLRQEDARALTLESGLDQVERMQAESRDDSRRESRYGLHKGWRQAILARHELLCWLGDFPGRSLGEDVWKEEKWKRWKEMRSRLAAKIGCDEWPDTK